MPPKEIPDRWEPYIPIGSPVRGTRFIALKVPLKEHICAKLNPKFRWTINILTDTYPDIGMIVDLTLTTRYYDFVDVLNKGVDYCKVAIPGQQIPSESLVKRFFAAVDFYLDRRRDDSLIGVHCTHGVNRTGYMIARYMIQRLGFSVSDALESITVARGHPIERENYISDLGRHLEQLPKILDGSDIHKGRTAGEPPRVSLGIKATKKKKPLETRTAIKPMASIKVMDDLASVVHQLENSFKAARKEGRKKGVKTKSKGCRKTNEPINSLGCMMLKPAKPKKGKKKITTSKLSLNETTKIQHPDGKNLNKKVHDDFVAHDVEILKPSKLLQINSFLSDCVKQQRQLSARRSLGSPSHERSSNSNNTLKKNLIVHKR